MSATHDLLTILQDTEPVESRGWFRWLHNHFLGRYRYSDRDLDDLIASQAWSEVAQSFRGFSDEELSALVPTIGPHAWTVGYLGLTELADAGWKLLKPEHRGALLAGVTGSDVQPELLGWIRKHLPDCLFSPESACEIACNAIWHQWPDVLAAVLQSDADLTASIHRGDNGRYPETRWPDILAKLSHRVIDLILEAALVRNDAEAVRMALDKGANPNIPVWKLERSFNEKHCALTFAMSEERKDIAELLLEAGAAAAGTEFTTPNYPFYLAISKGWDAVAERLLHNGASLCIAEASAQSLSIQGSKSEASLPLNDQFFGHFDEDLDWASKTAGSFIPLAPIAEKQAFYAGNGQGGQWTTILNALVGTLERLQRYEALGLDTRLTAEEFCSAVDGDAFDGLLYLVGKHGTKARDRVLSRIRRRNPDFGAVCRPLEVEPQDNGINIADGFDPANQPALTLVDGSKLYVDFSAIAPPHHAHGPCPEGHFWLRIEEATWRRRQNRVVMTALRTRWTNTKFPANGHQVKSLLPCIRDIHGVRIRLGVTIGDLFFQLRPNDPRKDGIYAWLDTPEFQSVIEEASARILAQTQSNYRRPARGERTQRIPRIVQI